MGSSTNAKFDKRFGNADCKRGIHDSHSLADISLHVVRAFSDQLDEVKLIKKRLEKVKNSDPFEENGKPGLLLRHGFGLIDDTF